MRGHRAAAMLPHGGRALRSRRMRGRGRGRWWATLTSAPWRRAPLLLRRRPGVLATVAGATAVLAAAVASVPLFLSSVGSGAVAVQARERCPTDTGASVVTGVSDPGGTGGAAAVEVPSDPFTPLGDALGPARLSMARDVELARADGSGTVSAVLLTRDGATDNIDPVDPAGGPPGAGLWVSDRAASDAGLAPGDDAVLSGVPADVPRRGPALPGSGPASEPAGAPATAPVAGVYSDLAGRDLGDYWCSLGRLFLLQGTDPVPPPPVLVADRETFLDLVTAMDDAGAGGQWQAPLSGGTTLTGVDHLVDDLACGTPDEARLSWCEGVVYGPDGGISRFGDAGGLPPERWRDADDFVDAVLATSLPFVRERGRSIRASVAGGVVPVAGFAALAGAGLVGAAGALWFDRRRREVTLLTVRGVSPAALGFKAVLEVGLALVAGAAAGVALAYLAVRWLGPSPAIEPAAAAGAALAGAASLALGALVVGAVVAGLVRAHHGRRRVRRWLRFVPWELGLAGAALVSYRRLGEWGVPVSAGAGVSRVDVFGLLFPVLFLVAALAVAVRVLDAALGPVRRRSAGWPTALYLAVRRVARYRGAVTGLVAAAAVAAGVLAYAGTLNRSLDATLAAKAETFVGSDLAVRLGYQVELPDGIPRSTTVDVYRRAWVGERRLDTIMLAIDPATFESAVTWDPTFADASLDEILDRLDDREPGGTVPAVVVGAEVPARTEAGVTDVGTTRFPVELVADVDAFPGMKRGDATLIVSRSAVAEEDLPRPTTTEAWIAGDRDASLAALEAAGVPFQEDRTFTAVVDQAAFLTVSWTFAYMQSLGAAAGVLVVAGTAVYLDARRRDRVLGYAFARRMGLARTTHRRVLFVELAASVVTGCWLGLGIGLAGAWLAYDRVDPVPGFRPDPLLRPALGLGAALAVAAVVVAAVGAVVGQRRTDRDDPVEVLRAGT